MPTAACLAALLACIGAGTPPNPGAQPVTYRAGQDFLRALLYRPDSKGPLPAIIVVHGDAGLTDDVKTHAARLAGKGYAVLAVDLYRGEVAQDLMDAHILSRGVPDDRALADLKAAVDYLTRRPDVRADRIGILGWEMGGGYALDAAIADPRLRAVVVCSGRLVTDAKALRPLRASVLALFAASDEGAPPATLKAFETAMHQAGKRLAGMRRYQECAPDFLAKTHEGSAVCRAAADGWRQIDAFLAENLNRR